MNIPESIRCTNILGRDWFGIDPKKEKLEVRPNLQAVSELDIMDPFMTPPRWKPQIPRERVKKFIYKQEVMTFIESISFEYIQIPIDMTLSTDEALTTSFVRAFCDALADSLIKAPSKPSLMKLIERTSITMHGGVSSFISIPKRAN